ncbi:MAG: hypothetical protein WBF30_01065, partial [Candidatus Acidiferrales bacterium]
ELERETRVNEPKARQTIQAQPNTILPPAPAAAEPPAEAASASEPPAAEPAFSEPASERPTNG